MDQFDKKILPTSYNKLVEMCPISKIETEEHYDIGIYIVQKLGLLGRQNKTKEQEKYLDEITDYIIEYEDKYSRF